MPGTGCPAQPRQESEADESQTYSSIQGVTSMNISRRKSTLSLAAAAAIGVAGTGAASATDLVVVSWGGAYTASQQKAYHEPYMKMNSDINIINDDGSANALAGLRAQAQAGNVTWDLVDMLPSDAQLACDEGILLPLDHDAMLDAAPDGTPASEDFLPGSLGECYVSSIVYST